MARHPLLIPVERYPIAATTLTGVRCKFCDKLFVLSHPGKTQFFVSEDGKKPPPKRGRENVGELVYMCYVCQIRGATDTVDGMKLIDFGHKRLSEAEIKRRQMKERVQEELNAFGRETWAGWKP